jgi:hypothetical protein
MGSILGIYFGSKFTCFWKRNRVFRVLEVGLLLFFILCVSSCVAHILNSWYQVIFPSQKTGTTHVFATMPCWFAFFLVVVLGFELRALLFLDKHSSLLPALVWVFCFVSFCFLWLWGLNSLLARQVLYHMSHSTSPVLYRIFSR